MPALSGQYRGASERNGIGRNRIQESEDGRTYSDAKRIIFSEVTHINCNGTFQLQWMLSFRASSSFAKIERRSSSGPRHNEPRQKVISDRG